MRSPGEMPEHRLTGPAAVAALADLGFASIASGVIARRRKLVGLLERTQADRRAVTRIHALRQRFGSGPVELAIPGRRFLVILDPHDVKRVLEETPQPFDPASWEKRHALEKFQPHAVLISRGPIRGDRRRLNEAALDTSAELHHLAGHFAAVIAEEMSSVTAQALNAGGFDSAQFVTAWWRLTRRLVLGDTARDDEAVTDDLWRLRQAGNWSFVGLPQPRRRHRFIERLYEYAENASPDSLLGALATTPAGIATDPIGQVPHWLFAFDAAGMALLRCAALLASRPEELTRCETADPGTAHVRPYLRACILESVRLWPTTPTVLRETTVDTTWGDGDERFTVRTGASVLIALPAFHRDRDLLPFAHDFVPDIWLDGRAGQYPQLVPFSAGPAGCPGRNLVLFTTSSALAQLFSTMTLTLTSPSPLGQGAELPITFNQFGLEFRASPRTASVVGHVD
jgi:cytochrome P450